jgi:GTP:adenosylcobinamide-phosphate guanylyltransferase
MGEWTAIVLAGERPGETGFASAYGVPAKALIPVAGEPMLSRVARTLLGSPSIGRILVLAQQPDALFAGGAAWLANEPRIGTAVAGDGISASVAEVAGSAAAPWPVLVTTADHALLRPEMIEAFIGESKGADAAFAMVERKVVEQAYPQTKRTWITLRDGHYSGANLFALRTPASLSGVRFWSRAEQYRKTVWRLLLFFGPSMFLRAVTRTLSLDEASARAGRKLRLRLRPVLLPYAEASIDVDKPADLELAERILAGRAGPGPGKAPA